MIIDVVFKIEKDFYYTNLQDFLEGLLVKRELLSAQEINILRDRIVDKLEKFGYKKESIWGFVKAWYNPDKEGLEKMCEVLDPLEWDTTDVSDEEFFGEGKFDIIEKILALSDGVFRVEVEIVEKNMYSSTKLVNVQKLKPENTVTVFYRKDFND